MLASTIKQQMLSSGSAYSGAVTGLGSNHFERVVTQLFEPLSLAISVLNIASWVIGGAFMFGTVGRYLQYRENPSQAPLGQALFLGALGIAFILLPTAGRYLLPVRYIL